MVLVKLCLNSSEQGLAYRFGVSQSIMSKNWKKWLAVMCMSAYKVGRINGN